LLVALSGALVAGPGLLKMNLARLRLAIPVGVIASTCAMEVTNESISKIITNHMALPISYFVGTQIPFQDSNWQSCQDGRELCNSLFGVTKL